MDVDDESRLWAVFDETLKADPKVWDLFHSYSWEAISKGWSNYSARDIFGRLRWHVHIETSDADFKLNNVWSPYYGRLFMWMYPHLGPSCWAGSSPTQRPWGVKNPQINDGFFELRAVKTHFEIEQRLFAWAREEGNMTAAKPFAIKKTRKTGECAAMRCTDPSTRDCPFDELWQTSDAVELCDRHMATALAYAETLTQGAAIVQSSPQLPSTWVQTAAEVVRKIQDSEQEATETLQALAEIRVDSHEDLECVNECLRDTKTRRNEIKASEDGILAPVKQLLRQISDMTTPAKKAWEQVEGTLRGIVSAAALAEAERNRKLAQQAAEAHAEGSDAVALLGRMTTATDLQGTSVKIVWVAVVEDASKLPDAYIERRVNQQALKAYADSFEGREPAPLPGVSFVQDAALRVRSR